MAAAESSHSLVDRPLFRVSINVKPGGKRLPGCARAHLDLKTLHIPLPFDPHRFTTAPAAGHFLGCPMFILPRDRRVLWLLVRTEGHSSLLLLDTFPILTVLI